jgi:RNA polymerase sigma factor (sigma-70 family)
MIPIVQASGECAAARSLERRLGRTRRVPLEVHEAAELDWPAVKAAFRAGDAAAADAAATHLLPLVARLVRRLAGWNGEADDLTQDVLVAALAARERFRGDAKLETWITRIAINTCRAHARKAWLRKKLFQGWARGRPAASLPPASEIAEDNEQAAVVRRAVADLPTKLREAIVLCYLQNMTPAEAAEVLGVRPGTVEVRLSRGRERLRGVLSK